MAPIHGATSKAPLPLRQLSNENVDTAQDSSTTGTSDAPKKKKHRAGRKRKNRRQSFAAPSDHGDDAETDPQRPSLLDVPEDAIAESSFYRIRGENRSDTSLDSQTLLDHRGQSNPKSRRQSNTLPTSQPTHVTHHPSHSNFPRPSQNALHNPTPAQEAARRGSHDIPDDDFDVNDRTPLIPTSGAKRSGTSKSTGYGVFGASTTPRQRSKNRRPSTASSVSVRRKSRMPPRQMSSTDIDQEFDINNPPSVPGSPRLGGDDAFDEVMLPEFSGSPETFKSRSRSFGRDAVIDIDTTGRDSSPKDVQQGRRRRTGDSPGEDVCLPFDRMTDIAEEDYMHQEGSDKGPRRSRRRPWPDLSALEEWSHEEKQGGFEGLRAKRVNEPEFVGGRLRAAKVPWQREAEEAPFRFTYFNEELDSSLRSYTISGLEQLGYSFRELFIPDYPELDESSSEDEEEYGGSVIGMPDRSATPVNGLSRAGTRQSSILDHRGLDKQAASENPSATQSGQESPKKARSPDTRHKRFGPRPVFWLDVLQPTYEEMRVISRAFGIHKLTAEDIMEQEAREKVELFRNYYFVNYRTFEQDQQSEEYMDAVNMYFVVFKGGVISFHFSQMPHPPNVRRRIRQLAEHQYTDSDWISYAIIDNITDAYAPLIEQIEKEVDDIDDEILQMHSRTADPDDDEKTNKSSSKNKNGDYEKVSGSEAEEKTTEQSGADMLLRVGECRKKVMGLYRLLGNKADVIKGLAKRCNEQWQVAPRSDVGLYLGDIQDHIVTMTANLTHYENILSRAHSNYLAQINIKMTEKSEQTNDVLNKLTVLSTIVLPMNIVTGMWGMNVIVPGQDHPSLTWFWCITAGLVLFGVTCFFIAKRVYRVV